MNKFKVMVQFEISPEMEESIPKDKLTELTSNEMNKLLSQSFKGNIKITLDKPHVKKLEKMYYIFTPEQLLATLTNENLLKLAGFLEREVEARKKMLDFEEKS